MALSACQSGSPGGLESVVPLAVALMGKAKIPIVSAMTGEVSEQACRLYTRRFVAAIHDGESIVEASAKGRRAALQNAENSADYIDWALPALFLASSVQPDFCPVDPRAGRELMRIARGLQLPSKPVFIGSQEILRMADEDLIHPDPDKGIGFVAITNQNISKLGGTRLLREIGFRLLRRGHLPLLLAPYSETTAPKSLRAVVCDILDKLLAALVQLKQAPFPLTVLAADPGFTAPSAGVTTVELQDAVVDFTGRDGDLEPGRVRWRLAADLAALARAAAAVGEPFGEHTRVVVLGDEFQYWVKGLDGILEIIKDKVDSGLGTADCPVPLIVTGSLGVAGGPKLKLFTDDNSAIVRVPPLAALPLPEAILGFEWVLLHPLFGDPEPAKRVVYRARGTRTRRSSEGLRPAPRHSHRSGQGAVLPCRDAGEPRPVRHRRRRQGLEFLRGQVRMSAMSEYAGDPLAQLRAEAEARMFAQFDPVVLSRLVLIPAWTDALAVAVGLWTRKTGPEALEVLEEANIVERRHVLAPGGQRQEEFWVRARARTSLAGYLHTVRPRLDHDLDQLRQRSRPPRGERVRRDGLVRGRLQVPAGQQRPGPGHGGGRAGRGRPDRGRGPDLVAAARALGEVTGGPLADASQRAGWRAHRTGLPGRRRQRGAPLLRQQGRAGERAR